MAERDRSIDVARMAAAFLIVLFHAGETYSMAGGGLVLGQPPWMIVGQISLWGRVPFFFFLSGCFAARSLEKPGVSWEAFVGKRLKVLGLPYLFWNLVSLGMLFAAVRMGAQLENQEPITAGSALMKATGIGMLPANGPLWFIRDLILVSCLAPLLRRFGVWLLVPCFALTILPDLSQEMMLRGCPRPSSLGFFGLGMLLNLMPSGTVQRLFPRPGLGFLLCLGVGLIQCIWRLDPPRLAGISVGAMGILLLGRFVDASFPRIADWAGRHANASFIIFAANVPFFAVGKQIALRLPDKVPLLLFFAVLAVAFFFLAVAFHQVIRRFAPSLLVFLSGGR